MTKDYTNLKQLSINKLKPRSYFLPFKKRNDILNSFKVKARENNEIFELLSGEWQFKYFNASYQIPNDIFNKDYLMDKISVPSCWQFLGYEEPFYVNNDFQMPAIPPYIPKGNPVGVYKKEIIVSNKFDNQIIYLSFLGVASSFTLFINGVKVGFAQGSHNMHEFDITSYVSNGENTIVVYVYKWNFGSYLESQDMFRNNGIFRDVYLTYLPKSHIYDFKITTSYLNDNKWDLNVNVIQKNFTNKNILKYTFFNQKKDVIKELTTNDININLEINNPLLWNAEEPNLYYLMITVFNNDVELYSVFHQVGFIDINYVGPEFKVNFTPIKIKGVNHHDSNPNKGYVMDFLDIKKDVELIKKFNCNTIRTAHYPPDPILIELCNEIGLYVIDEADLETYGALNLKDDKDYFGFSPEFKEAIIDRTIHLYERDKNHPSIIMWSIGNESGVGPNLDSAYEWLKETQIKIPIQYETCFREWYKNENGYDIVSLMYPSLELIQTWMDKKEDNRPFYLCEYAHSMGLSPGGMKEYFEMVYKYDKFIGGCIWEWADHSVVKYEGNEKYFSYGGDHGEYVHDKNFCVDGIVDPNRNLKTSTFEMINVYRPIRFNLKDNIIQIKNTNSFLNSNIYQFEFILLKDGKSIDSKTFNFDIKALETEEILIEDIFDITNYKLEYGEVYLNIFTKYQNETIGTDTILIQKVKEKETEYNFTEEQLKLNDLQNKIIISNKNKQIIFDKNIHSITSIKIDNLELINQTPLNRGYGKFEEKISGFIPNIWRALIDNDMYINKEWEKHFYNYMWTSFYKLDYEINEKYIKLINYGYFSPPKYGHKFNITTTYTIFNDFKIEINFRLMPHEKDLPELPRFGFYFEMPKAFNNVKWYGLGPNENYSDFKEHAYMGTFERKVSNFYEPYIKPQEHGNRSEVRWVSILNNDNKGLKFSYIDKHFNFQAKHFDLTALSKATHTYLVKDVNTTQVFIDGFMRGVGTGACGWPPFEPYIIPGNKTLEFKVLLELIE